MDKTSKIYVAGSTGMVGSAVVRALLKAGYKNILKSTREEVDLVNQRQTEDFFSRHKPDYVFLAAAKVGGIHANNSYPADFIYQNLMIQSNVIYSSYKSAVKGLLFFASSCIYPKFSQQPIKEAYLLQGDLEKTNQPYALAKIVGIEMCNSYNRQYGTDFRSVMPANVYGVGDNYHPDNSHVLAGIIAKMHAAKTEKKPEVTLWGSGSPRREFLFADDLADGAIFIMNLPQKSLIDAGNLSHINIGCGFDLSIKELAEMIKQIVGYEGKIVWDTSKPDGTERKLLDVSLQKKLGWNYKTNLEEGINKAYDWFLANRQNLRML